MQCEKFTDVAYQNNEEACREKIELVRAISKVKLYLNVTEPPSSSLIEKIENIPYDFMGKAGGAKEFASIKSGIEEKMQEILKEEWNRVRDGEWLWKVKKHLNINPLLKLNSYPRYQVNFLFVLLIVLIFQLLYCVINNFKIA